MSSEVLSGRAAWPAALAAAVLTLALSSPGRAQPAAAASAASAAPASAASAAEPRTRVRAFRVEGNSLLDPGLLQATLHPWLGQRTLAELRDAAQAVQALYGQAGYGAVLAYLPPQPVADGTLLIQVVEGRLARITVQGARRLTPERVRAALPTLQEGVTPQVRRIDAELQLANENPGRTMGVLLGPGAAPGEVEASVKVGELPTQRWSLALDNSGNSRTGDYRLSLAWQHADLSDHDDVLSLQLQVSPTAWHAVQVLSAGYRLPLVRSLAALDLFAAYSDVDGGIQSTPAGGLRFAGKGRIAGARVTTYLPRWGEFDQRLTGGLESRSYLNDCQVSGLPNGSCGAAGQSVALQPLTIDYAAQTGGAAPASFTLALAHNLALGGQHGGAADFEAVRPGATRHYTVWRAGGQFSMPVAEDWLLAGRVSAQHSGDLLVPGEQFGLGGANSVRGYLERELSGDLGFAAGIELATPQLGAAVARPEVDLRALVFVDGGQVALHGDATCLAGQTRCSLSAWGLGARLGWRRVQLRLFVAQARHDAATTRHGEWRSHFALNASF